ncbi:hypothetical protein N658DRAFT_504656 [Parathielavia hyrcaniae]|uniref:Uncharacterized protein n=1 Tax=Parathielavia hyrcaniae TaxID=113614 RepID=A0AAN6QAS8_9PEZI|nr:hypothetical protein N658DRAFT_504656 [Parathielavia hyrcaniae]
MRLLHLLLTGLTPLAAAEILGSWTISALTRQCNAQDTSCTYTMALTTSYLNSPHNDDATTCSFTVQPRQAQQQLEVSSAALAASRSDFSAAACAETGRYRLNGGWELDVDMAGDEFLTLVVTDTTRDAYAFFGFREAELMLSAATGEGVGGGGGAMENVKKMGDAYRVGSFGSDADGGHGAGVDGKDGSERVERIARGHRGVVNGGAARAGRRDLRLGGMVIGKARVGHGGQKRVGMGGRLAGRDAEEDKKEWQIKGLTWSPNGKPNTTDWVFSVLDSQTGQEANCSLSVSDNGPSASFYGVPCGRGDNANFRISWGYNGAADSAVMTACYAPNGTNAWFGYEQVSRNQQLGDSKKEPVYWTGCA